MPHVVRLSLLAALRDETVWGPDAMRFQPGKRPISEFKQKSCVFAEQMPTRSCPAKQVRRQRGLPDSSCVSAPTTS